ncbi:MAG: signal peptidase II [Patescibacteria group bacterium]|nr:signal peptidase II [Patescibacteria group bacterium]
METTIKKIAISNKTVLFIILAVFFVAADRLLAALSLKGVFDAPIPLVGNIFSLHYVKNFYIAFSIPFSGPILTAIIGIIIIILIIYWLKLAMRNTNLAPLTILIIGAILNFTDRIEYGYVIDYFDLKYFTIFNLADIIIVAGVLIIILKGLTKKNYA